MLDAIRAERFWILTNPEFKPAIAQAAATAKARKSTKVCVVGQTDKLGDKNYNAKLAQARSQAVAGELIRAGYPAKDVIIAANPEAFGNLSFGSNDASFATPSKRTSRAVTLTVAIATVSSPTAARYASNCGCEGRSEYQSPGTARPLL